MPAGFSLLSNIWLASPLWSPLIIWFDLGMEVGCTENQLTRPIGAPVASDSIMSCTKVWSRSSLYRARSSSYIITKLQYITFIFS